MFQKQLVLAVCLFPFLWVSAVAQSQNVSQIISSYGYPVENHWVETTDGFVLSIVRIPQGKNQQPHQKRQTKRPVVFLQHGLLDSATTWVMNLPQESLGFVLADAGFDVFLGNARGNTYSSTNKYYSPDTKEFWDLVDWDNMIAQDLPFMLNKALAVSGEQSLVYIGHSQGTLMGFGGFPLQPDLAAKVDLFIALAPVAYVNNQESVLLTYLADLDIAFWLELLGEKEFLPSTWLLHLIADHLCVDYPPACADVIFLLCGWNINNTNETRMDFYMDQTPAGTSVRNMIHWSQAVVDGLFEMYDYGYVGNEIHYHSATPPLYNLQNMVHPPMAFFTGTQDRLADPTDVQHLLNMLPSSNKPVLVHNEAAYEHMDFVWGMDAHQKIYPTIVQLAQKYSRAV